MYQKLVLLFLMTSYLFAQDITIVQSKYFLDSSDDVTLENVYAKKDNFQNFNFKNTTFGLTMDTCWIYIEIENTTNKKLTNVIEFAYALHDYIYVLEYQDKKLVDEYLTGDLTPYNSRKVDVNNFVFPYIMEPNSTTEFIFKVNSQSSLNMGMSFYSKDEYYAKSKNVDFILGSYYGAVLIMLLYNTVLFFMIKERVYLDYVLFHFSYLCLQLGLNGLSFSFFWPEIPQINNYFVPLALVFANYFSIVFTSSFLSLKEHNKKLYIYFNYLKAIFIAIAIAIVFLEYSTLLKILVPVSLISIVSLMICGIFVLYTTRSVSAKYFVTAWSAILIGAVLTELQNIGVLNMNPITTYGSQIGAFLELALLSFALAHRYNSVFIALTQRESEISLLNSSLQEKVEFQTKNLTLLIQELHHRVKNNFQVILTFLWAQKNSINDTEAIKALEQTSKRIYAISSLHELLDVSNTLSIDIQKYMNEIINSFNFQGNMIEHNILIDNIELNYDEAVAIGLILNELLTNSYKYAFKGIDNPSIYIKLIKEQDRVVFIYKDNGIGYIQKSISNSGLGHELINGFISKLKYSQLTMKTRDEFYLKVSFENAK